LPLIDGFLAIELLMFNFYPLSTNLVVVLALFGHSVDWWLVVIMNSYMHLSIQKLKY